MFLSKTISVYSCKYCDDSYEVVDEDGNFGPHDVVESETVAPTCETDGYSSSYCLDCGKTFSKK